MTTSTSRLAPTTSPISYDEGEQVAALLAQVSRIFDQRIVGQQALRTALTSSLLADGHVLLESVPGLAKTTAAQTLADAVSGSFHRIQCTPDLMPNDIIGTQIYHYATGEFSTQLGPVHANMVLMDEINRSSAKTQSAMLEAMQERQTSIGGTEYRLPKPCMVLMDQINRSSAKTQSAMLEAMQERQTSIGGTEYRLPKPFMVLATQNPIEEEGTYVLPEAQMDRFLMKEIITYPGPEDEVDVL